MFTKMDTDCSGSLSKDELKSGLAAVGFEGEQADIILDELEYDDDGKFNCDEFLEVVSFSEMFIQSYCS